MPSKVARRRARPPLRIRPALPDEHALLSRIARSSKAHWGYPARDLARWRSALTVSAASIARLPTYVAERDGRVLGFFQLRHSQNQSELEHFWVSPSEIGKGVGRALLEHARREVSASGRTRLLIDSDPNAEFFYASSGAVRVGEKPAPSMGQPQRVRPQLVLDARAG